MRTFPALTILLLAVVVSLAGCAGGAKPPVVDTAAIKAAVDSVGQAVNTAIAAKDTNAVVALYADDAQLLAPNRPRAEGTDAIRQVWAALFRMPGAQLTLTSDRRIVSEAGDLVADVGIYEFKVTGPKQKPLLDVGKYVTVLQRVNGQWKIQVETWNSDSAPAPAR